MEEQQTFDFLKNYNFKEHEKLPFYNIDNGLFEKQYFSIDEVFRKEEDSIGKQLFSISYSFGTPFFANIIQKFEYSEILCGNEYLLLDAMRKGSMMDKLQKDMIELLAKSDDEKIILSYMEQRKVKVFVPKTIKFHNKLYLMNFDDTQKRVYTGSANMSDTAHSQYQGEQRYISNKIENYDIMFKEFEDIKNNYFDELKYDVYYDVSKDEHFFDRHPDKLPFLADIDSNHPLIVDICKIENTDKEMLDYNAIDEKLKNNEIIDYPKPKFINKEKKQVLIDSEYKKNFCSAVIGANNYRVEQNLKRSYPILNIDYESNNITLNNTLYKKDISIDEIKNDYDVIIQIMNGLEKYSLDPKKENVFNAQKELFKFLVWGFISPFLQEIRILANNLHLDYATTYPRIAFIMGASTNGKSKFTLLITKLISNNNMNFADKKLFSEKGLKEFSCEKSCMPVLFDDLVINFESKGILKIIKNDELDNNIPPVIFTINEENITKTETNRRMFSVYSEFKGINEKEIYKDNFRVLEIIQEKATNSLFSEIAYKYILPKITMFREKILLKEKVSYVDFDFYNIVSLAFIDIWNKLYNEPLPSYINELKIEDTRFNLEINETTKETIYNWLDVKKEYFKIVNDKVILSDAKKPDKLWELQKKLPKYIKTKINTDGFTIGKAELENFLNCKLEKNMFKGINYKKNV